MGGVRSTLLSSVNNVQENVADTLTTVRNTIAALRQDASTNMNNAVNEGLVSVRTITHRADLTVFLLTNTLLALAAALALSLLLYLTDFSPFLRNIVWTMFVLLCCLMINNYIRHSSDVPRSLLASEEQVSMNSRRNPSLKVLIKKSAMNSVLDLVEQNLVDDDMEFIVAEGILNRKCTGLRLGCNHFTSDGALVLARALVDNDTLEHLNLCRNGLKDVGVQSLAESISLKKNELRTLDLSENGLTDQGLRSLARMLKSNQLLTDLFLAGNDITDEGIQSLAQALCRSNNTLQVLSLSRSELLDDTSTGPLIRIIQQNQSLTQLWLDDCNLSKNGQKKLRTAAASRKTMKLYL